MAGSFPLLTDEHISKALIKREFEELAAREDAFTYPIHHVKPRR